MNIRSYLTLPFVFLLAACLGMGEQKPAPVSKFGQGSGAGSAGVHNVAPGDTLYTVSQNYHLPMRDIVFINNLRAPFRLEQGMRLKLPPPREYRVQQGDSLYTVSRLFSVNSSEIVRLNSLQPPYAVRPGQVLRMPSMVRSAGMAKMAAPVKAPVTGVEREILAPPPDVAPVENLPVSRQGASQNVAQSGYVSEPFEASQSGMIIPREKPNSPQAKSMKAAFRPFGLVPKRASSKFLRPVQGDVVLDFGPKKSGLHNDGINIKAERGTPVLAAENGVVVYAGNALKGSGNLVLVRHEDQWMTAYAHMDNISVQKGDVVERGRSIGEVGSTGSVDSPQLHFEVRRGRDALNPKNYLDK